MNIALTIAGSDSGGGAGIQADLKTFQQFGVFGTSVVVAVTAQNTRAISAIHAIPAEIVEKQIEAVAQDLPPAATKTGMLATAELVSVVARGIERYGLRNYVLDPVMVASSGQRLLARDAERELTRLLRLCSVVTPNLDEAGILTGRPVTTAEEMELAGHALVELGAGAALVTGGHLAGPQIVDVLVTRERSRRFSHSRIDTTSTHGTGCTVSAAVAAGLAQGRNLERAVEDALGFVRRAIETAPGLGTGNGPLNYLISPD